MHSGVGQSFQSEASDEKRKVQYVNRSEKGEEEKSYRPSDKGLYT